MNLILSPDKIGYPDWEIVPIGDKTGTLVQYLSLRESPKRWVPVPWFDDEGHMYPCRFGNNYRRPVTWKGKLEAYWAAKGKIFNRYILRKKNK